MDVEPPSAVLLASAPAASVLGTGPGRVVGGEGPCGAEGAGKGSQEKRFKLCPGSWEWETALLRQRETEEQAARARLPWQLCWGAL